MVLGSRIRFSKPVITLCSARDNRCRFKVGVVQFSQQCFSCPQLFDRNTCIQNMFSLEPCYNFRSDGSNGFMEKYRTQIFEGISEMRE